MKKLTCNLYTLAIQRFIRRMLGRKWRRAFKSKLKKMVTRIERFAIRYLRKRRVQKYLASARIQKVYRGHRGRITAGLVRKYKKLPDELVASAITIQCFFRVILAKRESNRQRKLMQLQLRYVHKAATKISRAFNTYMNSKVSVG